MPETKMPVAKTSARCLVPWGRPDGAPELSALVQRPVVAAVRLHGAALADATACRALTASIRAAGRSGELPLLIALSPHEDSSPHQGTVPEGLRPAAPGHLALDLASGGEDFEVTLKVLIWARPVADLGIDLVLSPRLDRTPPLDDSALAARLTSAWTEALLAAGLVACAGPWSTGQGTEPETDDAWAPVGAAVAHGLEAVFVDDVAHIPALRANADDLVVVGPPVSDVDQAKASCAAGVDLIPLAEGLATEEIDAILEAVPSDGASRAAARVDRLREDWLV